jgi:4-oxalocrotonate tautomerase
MPLIQITMIEGRSDEQRRALLRGVTDAVEQSVGAPRGSIRVILQEVPATHWAVGGEPKG